MNSRNDLLDAVRGIAIIQIILWHIAAPPLRDAFPASIPFLLHLWSGVDLFFVLSGFLIGGVLLRSWGEDDFLLAFYARRFLRIAPLYAVAILLLFSVEPQAEPLLALSTFTQNILWTVQGRWGHQFIAVTWSLAVEEQFYLVLPFMILWFSPRSLPWILTGLFLAAPILRTLVYLVANDPTFAVYTLFPMRMDSLFIGVILAWMTQTPVVLAWFSSNRWIAVASASVFAICVCLFAYYRIDAFHPIMMTIGYTCFALLYASVVALAATSNRAMPIWLRPVAWMGLRAYSLYLFHYPVSLILNWFPIWSQLPTPSNEIVHYGIYSLTLLSVAALCYIPEKWFISVGQRYFSPKSRQVIAIE